MIPLPFHLLSHLVRYALPFKDLLHYLLFLGVIIVLFLEILLVTIMLLELELLPEPMGFFVSILYLLSDLFILFLHSLPFPLILIFLQLSIGFQLALQHGVSDLSFTGDPPQMALVIDV